MTLTDPPEVFLIKAYLELHPNQYLEAKLGASNHHSLFSEMVNLGLATDNNDARSTCYSAFKVSSNFVEFFSQMKEFLNLVVTHFEKS